MTVNRIIYFASILLLCIFTSAFPQNLLARKETGSSPLSLSIGTVRTRLEKAAVRYTIRYAEDLSGRDFQMSGNNLLLYFAPDLDIETGEQDAFNGVIVKATGNVLFFGTTEIAGIPTIDTSFFHAVPISIGVETNRGFNNVSTLAEAGYVPWFQGKAPKLLKKSYLGFFLQGGYKIEVDEPVSDLEPIENGGDVDESGEKPDSGLFRLKGSAKYGLEKIINSKTGFGVGFMGAADVWYDVVNTEFYYRLKAAFRIILNSEHSFDFQYQRGSGAPNFNEGGQLSANLTFKL